MRDTTNALLVATPEVIDQAIDVMTDQSVPIETRGALYAGLRRLRLRIDRVLRPVTHEIEAAMVAAGAEQWGPLQLRWRSVDARYPVNDPGNWEDATAQDDLAELRTVAAYRPFITEIPRHLEVDTAGLGKAIGEGDPGARELFGVLKDRRYRTDEGKTASLTVREDAA